VSREIHLELLLSRPVAARNGRSIGRIEEARIARRGRGAVVEAFLIGPRALLERLSLRIGGKRVRRWLQAMDRGNHYWVRWDQLDLSDPERPRLRCAVEELEAAAHPRAG
jgi:hypothetical protein